MQKIAEIRAAESQVAERSLCIELHWKKTSSQLGFIRQIWDELDDEYQDLQERVLQTLAEKLSRATANLEKVVRKPSRKTYHNKPQAEVRRFKYALLKESLDSTIEDLATWQRLFDPTWLLVVRMSSPLIEREFSRPELVQHHQTSILSKASCLRSAMRSNSSRETKLFLGDDELKTGEVLEIPFSIAKTFRRASSKTWMILDIVECMLDSNLRQMKEDIRDLGSKLSVADPELGNLQCRGVVIETDDSSKVPKSFDILFSMPNNMSNPQSLRAHLITGTADQSLSDRLKIAKQLVQCVSYIHLYGFVHKNIRPETILCFDDHQSTLRSAFLVGFQKFRQASGMTLMRGDMSWEANLYRHPDRQGMQPESNYVMQHDIYSLGVCLLEIGLWETFIVYGEDLTTTPSFLITSGDAINTSFILKDKFVSLAKKTLPSRMGNLYAQVVMNCLTCLDPDNEDFGDETQFEDRDGILIAVKYIEKVMMKMGTRSAIR